jgi:plastocyanin
MKKYLLTLLSLSSLVFVLIACGGSTGNTSNENMVTIHTDMMSFGQASVTLKSGQNLQLINDASDSHTIDLGTWQQGVAKPEQEPDAPQVLNEQLNGNGNLIIGPWKTPGTYQIYCPIHLNMNLTVIVQ